jgi:hypothetical protein
MNVASALLASNATFDAFANLIHHLGLEAAAGETNILGVSLACSAPSTPFSASALIENKLAYLYLDARSRMELQHFIIIHSSPEGREGS